MGNDVDMAPRPKVFDDAADQLAGGTHHACDVLVDQLLVDHEVSVLLHRQLQKGSRDSAT